jgi:uncharacterized protein YggT (Ycf19 family)
MLILIAGLFWLTWFLRIFLLVILLRVIIVWFNPANYPWLQPLISLTDPGLEILNLVIPRNLSPEGFDCSPLVALVILIFIGRLLKLVVDHFEESN